MKKTLLIILLAGFTLAGCNSNGNSGEMQDSTDTIDDGSMNHSGDTLSNSTDSTLRQQP